MTPPPIPAQTTPRSDDTTPQDRQQSAPAARDEREELLDQVADLLERPMIVLSFVWLVLVVLDLAGYKSRLLETASNAIWVVFVLDFVLRFVIAPRKGAFLKANWLTAVSLLAPALRLLRIARLVRALRAARAARGLRLLRVVSTANRGLRTARHTLARRGLGYVLFINGVVLFLGAGGMLALERTAEGGGLRSYGDALWWTAMLLTTLGAGYEPITPEGRLLAWLLALFAFSVFGYVTASFASLFVQQDQQATAPPAQSAPGAAASDGAAAAPPLLFCRPTRSVRCGANWGSARSAGGDGEHGTTKRHKESQPPWIIATARRFCSACFWSLSPRRSGPRSPSGFGFPRWWAR
jgi:voltage-gated potassium channel